MYNYGQIANTLSRLSRKEQYEMLLQTSEWFNFRNKIIERDNRTCVKCNKIEGPSKVLPISEEEKTNRDKIGLEWMINFWEDMLNKKLTNAEKIKISIDCKPLQIVGYFIKEVVLNVHHKYYYWTCLPWQYELNDLETLCSECHRKTHLENKIVTYYDEKKEYYIEEELCSRCGGEGYIKDFKHIQEGICFSCLGRGIIFNDEPHWVKVK
jgi:hypothetical protein